MSGTNRIISVIFLSTMLSTTSTATTLNEARRISAGDPAPWGGVILPPEQFLYLDSELAACRYVQNHPQPCEEETDYKGYASIGMFSFGLGTIVGLFVLRK